MPGRENRLFPWSAWAAAFTGLALAGVFLGSKGLAEGGPASVAGVFCYSWALLSGIAWHGTFRRTAAFSGVLLALTGVAGSWLVISFTLRDVSLADALVRILASVVLFASGITAGESLGRRWSYAAVFGVNAVAFAFAYAAVDVLDGARAARIACIPAVLLAPVIQAVGGEILGVALWAVFAASLVAVKLLRARPASSSAPTAS
ncbi:MAG: hypothetical protein JW909_00115 [Planctomycetes bacterium]|nr:hypothetical protein [Planctomycetota bacterium]